MKDIVSSVQLMFTYTPFLSVKVNLENIHIRTKKIVKMILICTGM